MNKTRITFQFSTLSSLWSFRMAIDAKVFEMNPSSLTITCSCSKEDVELATSKYAAKVISVRETA